MCTPGDDALLIAGTVLGSLYLYDLNEFDSSQDLRADELNYESLLHAYHPELASPDQQDSEFYIERLQQVRSRFGV